MLGKQWLVHNHCHWQSESICAGALFSTNCFVCMEKWRVRWPVPLTYWISPVVCQVNGSTNISVGFVKLSAKVCDKMSSSFDWEEPLSPHICLFHFCSGPLRGVYCLLTSVSKELKKNNFWQGQELPPPAGFSWELAFSWKLSDPTHTPTSLPPSILLKASWKISVRFCAPKLVNPGS